MGMQIPDIATVIHIGTPKSVMSYWQELGRCARDGSAEYGLVVYDGHSLALTNTSEEIRMIIIEYTL